MTLRRILIVAVLAAVSIAILPSAAGATPDCRGIEKVFHRLGMDYACPH